MESLNNLWISIYDLLPDEGQEIVAIRANECRIQGESSVVAGIYYGGRIEISNQCQAIIINNISHWIPAQKLL